MSKLKTKPKDSAGSTPEIALGKPLPTEAELGATVPAGTPVSEERVSGHASTVSVDSQAHGRWDAALLPVIERSSYAVGGEFARGGIGRILRARDGRLRRPVALKELLDDEDQNSERFVREALLTARLQHPSIVPVYEAGRWPSGEPFYAMKLVSGRSLHEVITATRTTEERIALLPHVVAVTEAIAYAHSERIIHRDLKPHNILVGAFGETVVIDWGLAKDLADPAGRGADEGLRPYAPDGRYPTLSPQDPQPGGATVQGLTMTGSVMGTPAYMPPEQAAGRPVDERADVYALGAILYHVLAGEPPYDGATSMQILVQVAAGPPSPLERSSSEIPQDLSTIVKKAMARDPAARYPTAKELAEDLRRFQTGQIVHAHQYSSLELLRRFVRRYRAPLAVAVTAFLVLVVVGAWGMRKIIAERTRAVAKQAEAEAAHKKAAQRADELTLVQADASLDRDPSGAIDWLRSLSPAFEEMARVRVIAADAKARGIGVVLREHTAPVNGVGFRPGSRVLATCSDDTTVRVRDLDKGTTRALEGHTDAVWRCVFSPDGKLLASAGKDKTVRLWDAETGALRKLVAFNAPVTALAFSTDGKRIAAFGLDAEGRLWDIDGGELRVLIGHKGEVEEAAFTPDNKLLVTGSKDRSVRVWDVATGQSRTIGSHDGAVTHVAVSPNGKLAATASYDKTVRLWELATGKSRVLSGHRDLVWMVAFSPDGKTLASGSKDATVRLWDVASGVFEDGAARGSKPRRTEAARRIFEGHNGGILRVAFSSDGRLLGSASADHSVRLWDVARGESRSLLGCVDAVAALAFSSDDSTIAAGCWDNSVRLYRTKDGPTALTSGHTDAPGSFDVSPDGTRLVSARPDGTTRLWSVASIASPGSDITEAEPTILRGHDGAVQLARFSPSGELVATGGLDGSTRLWDLSGHAVWTFGPHLGGVSDLVFSPDARFVLSAGMDGFIQIGSVDSGQSRLMPGHDPGRTVAAFSPDSASAASGGEDKKVMLWSVATGTGRLLGEHDEEVTALAFSPDNRTLASGSEDHTVRLWSLGEGGQSRLINAGGNGISQIVFTADGEAFFTIGKENAAHLWNVRTGEELRVFRGHEDSLNRAAISPNGRVLATASADHTVRLWDIESAEGRALRGHTGPVLDVRFSPDGRTVISADRDGIVRLWPDDLPEEPDALRAWLNEAGR